MARNLIRNIDFNSLQEAELFLASFIDYGKVHRSPQGIIENMNFETGKSKKPFKTYISHTNSYRYNYSLFKNEEYSITIEIYRTYMHPMIHFAQIGDIEGLKENINLQDNLIYLSLSEATKNGQLKIIKFFIENYDLNALPSKFMETAFYYSIQKNQPKILEYLISRGCKGDIFARSLHNDSLEVFELFLEMTDKGKLPLPKYDKDSWENKLLKSNKNKTIKLALSKGFCVK